MVVKESAKERTHYVMQIDLNHKFIGKEKVNEHVVYEEQSTCPRILHYRQMEKKYFVAKRLIGKRDKRNHTCICAQPCNDYDLSPFKTSH